MVTSESEILINVRTTGVTVASLKLQAFRLVSSALGLLASRKFQMAILTLIAMKYAPALGVDWRAILAVFGGLIAGHTVTDCVNTPAAPASPPADNLPAPVE